MNENAKKDIALGLFLLFAGIGIGLSVGWSVFGGRLESTDRELAEHRDRTAEFASANDELKKQLDDARSRIVGLSDTISRAVGIAQGINLELDAISSQGGDALAKLRRTIDALKAIQGRVRELEGLDNGVSNL